MADTDTMRRAVVAEALTWLRTPYHHAARIKGVGVDCAQFLIAVYAATGLIDDFTPDRYPPDWHLHRTAERFLSLVLDRARPTDDPGPGDVVLMRFGRAFSHGGVVVGDGHIVHAFLGRGVELADLSEWARRPKRYFTLIGAHEG